MALSTGFRQPLGNGILTEVAGDADGYHVEANFNYYNPGFNAYHMGEDWNGDGATNSDLGQPVFAISNGTVVERGVLDSFGNYLIIRHDLPQPITLNGITTSTVYSLYGHFQNPSNVSVGDVVSMGQQIGTMGSTGAADGNAHVHLEIRLGYGAGYENTDGYAIGAIPPGWVDPTDFINAYRTISDTTAPLLSSASPADNATAVAVGSNIVMTFNEAVAAGSGNIVIYNANGSVAQTIAVTDSSQVSFSGNTVTINPSSDLAANSGYYVNLGAGVIKDVAGNNYAGISDATSLNFTTAAIDLAGDTLAAARVVTLGSTTSTFTDYVGPADPNDYYKFTTTGPTNFALSLTGLSDDADVYLLNSAGVEVTHSYNFGTAPEAITVSNLAAGTYYVQVKPYNTASTNYTLGLSAAPVGDTTAPLLSSASPADNATAVAVGSNIVMTFNEAVAAGSGNIVIYNANGSVAQTIAVTDSSQVSFSGNTVTINPSSDLAANSGYYVNLGAGVIKDVAGNNYAGISDATSLNFTTAAIDLAGDTLAAARVVTLGSTTSTFTDYVGPADPNDYYKFTTTGPTNFALSLTGLSDDADVYLLNSAGVEVTHSYNFGTAPEAITVSNLAAGTYYVQVKPYNTASTNYTLGLSAAPVGDTTAPLLSSASPADNATAVAVGSNIVMTFNEAVAAGSGNIVIYNANGSVAQTIAVTDSSQVSFSGNTVTINPSSDLAANSGYYVNLGAGVIKDVAGNNYAGISDATSLNFTTAAIDLAGDTLAAARVVTLGSTTSTFTDYVGPADPNDYYKFTTTGPTNFALSLTGLSDDADVYLLNSAGVEVTHSYNFGTAPEAITVSNLAAGTYYVQVKPYNTASTNYTLGLSAAPVGDTTAPLLSSASPADNATAVAVGSNIVMTFNEAVAAGSGNIVIYNANGSVAQTIAVTDSSQVSFSGNTVTINPSSDLAANSGYYVNLGAGVIKDVAGNNYAGISDATSLNFTTAAIDLAGDTLAAARVVTLGSTTSTFTDYVGPADPNDYYKFTTTGPTNFALSLTGLSDDADVYLLNSAGVEVTHSYNFGTAPEAITVSNLAAGSYYVQVKPYNTASTNYTLGMSAKPLTLSSTSATLDASHVDLTLTGTAAINGTGNALDNAIAGNSGNNILAGLGGADHLDGGAGTDTATYAASNAGVNVSLSTGQGSGGDADGDTLVNIENLTGSNFDDRLEGDASNNVLTGGTNGALGDTVSYEHATAGVTVNLATTTAQNTIGAGTDTLTGFENIIGSAFNDTLVGTSAANTISGGDGNDKITGGGGADILTGGAGADNFVFTATTDSATGTRDVITDFVHGTDVIDLSAIDANTSVTGNQAFLFGDQNVNVVARSVTWFEDAANAKTIIQADVDGNTTADLTITLNGINHHLTALDFIL